MEKWKGRSSAGGLEYEVCLFAMAGRDGDGRTGRGGQGGQEGRDVPKAALVLKRAVSKALEKPRVLCDAQPETDGWSQRMTQQLGFWPAARACRWDAEKGKSRGPAKQSTSQSRPGTHPKAAAASILCGCHIASAASAAGRKPSRR